jgi:hypothetical protein
MKLALALSAAILLCLTGCAVLNAEVAPRVAKTVNVYCLEPQASRLLIRQQVNALIEPNSIAITCGDDTP